MISKVFDLRHAPQRLEHLEVVHVGHGQVEIQAVRLRLSQSDQPLEAVRGSGQIDRQAPAGDLQLIQANDRGRVIDHQDVQLGRAPAMCRAQKPWAAGRLLHTAALQDAIR